MYTKFSKMLQVTAAIILLCVTATLFGGCAVKLKSDEFLAEYSNFEDEIKSFIKFCCAIQYERDDEKASNSNLQFWLDYVKKPEPLYVVWKTYEYETKLGTQFELTADGFYTYIPKETVKNTILKLYKIDEADINWEDFINFENAEKPDYFMLADGFDAGHTDFIILYDTLVYDKGKNTVTFNVRYYDVDGERSDDAELCVVKFEFQPVMYGGELQAYRFVKAELVSQEEGNYYNSPERQAEIIQNGGNLE